MQKIKHLFFVFSLALVFAPSVWGVDFNCQGGTWVFISRTSDTAITCKAPHAGSICTFRSLTANPVGCQIISGGTRLDYTYGQGMCPGYCYGLNLIDCGSYLPTMPSCNTAYPSNICLAFVTTDTYEWQCPDQCVDNDGD